MGSISLSNSMPITRLPLLTSLYHQSFLPISSSSFSLLPLSNRRRSSTFSPSITVSAFFAAPASVNNNNSVPAKNGGYTVGDFMTPRQNLHVVKPSTSVDDALELLVEKKVTGLPVIDDNWTLVGVVSDYDLLALDSISGRSQNDTNLFPDVDSTWKTFNELQKLISKTYGKAFTAHIACGRKFSPSPLLNMTIKPKSPARFKLGRQSSLAPESRTPIDTLTEDEDDDLAAAATAGIGDPTIRLMYLANEGDIDGINKMLDSGTNVDYRDIDARTALHVAACQGRTDVVELLLSRGAKVDTKDRWGSTPLADAVYYKNHDVIKLLEKHGAKPTIAPMHVLTDKEVPEYEIHPTELDFSNSVKISKGTFNKASWRGIDVAVKTFGEEMFTDEDKVNAFRDELALLQKIRHPNVVQFLGAVTQSTPMMIVTEYLPKGDLRQYLDRKGPLMPAHAVKFALEIARGMNYLHEHKPEAIIHCDLEPPNILRDDSGHLKVADFGVSKLLVVKKTVKKDRPVVTCLDSSWRYMAPEVYRNEEYDTKVDVFSFALILQEMIEGCEPFHEIEDREVPKAYIEDERPPFNAPTKSYPFGLQELIQDCWDKEASKRPTFRVIISTLELISDRIARKRSWKVMLGRCLPRFRLFTKRDYVNPGGSNRSSGSFNR